MVDKKEVEVDVKMGEEDKKRLESFVEELNKLQETYKVAVAPKIQWTEDGVTPRILIVDIKKSTETTTENKEETKQE